MRIAVTGKGGSGKSTLAGALARQLARSGQRVVAIDADPNPNLGISVGVVRETVESMVPILNALLDSGHTHNDPMPAAEDLLARYGVDAPDGVRLVATGKIERPSDSCLCCGSHSTTRQFFADLPSDGRVVLADLEAGLSDLVWAHPGSDDVVLVVSEGSAKSLEVAERGCRLAEQMGVRRIIGVANRAISDDEGRQLAERLGIQRVFVVPEDPEIEKADQLGIAAVDHDPDSTAMTAVAVLAAALVDERSPA
jgi:CO dehydrogenase maturation factor